MNFCCFVTKMWVLASSFWYFLIQYTVGSCLEVLKIWLPSELTFLERDFGDQINTLT